METATCPRCRTAFERPDGKQGGAASYCKPCFNAYQREYRKAHPLTDEQKARRIEWRREYAARNRAKLNEQAREYQMRKKLRTLGLSLREYQALLDKQSGGCAICHAKSSDSKRAMLLAVDHDHATGRVRGLLCGRCNMGLGLFLDDPDLLSKAILYLKE